MPPKAAWEYYMEQRLAKGDGVVNRKHESTGLPDHPSSKGKAAATHPEQTSSIVSPSNWPPFWDAEDILDKLRPRIISKSLQQKIVAELNNPDRAANRIDHDSPAASKAAASERTWSEATTPGTKKDKVAYHENIEVWTERDSVKSFKKYALKEGVQVREGWEGAASHLVTINAEAFQMPFQSKVICIKTESKANIVFSIRHGIWSNPIKVNSRITEMWQNKQAKEKIFFLFSVNGTGKYCGMAEMIAPIVFKGSLDGWEDNNQGINCEGATPLRWLFVKDVKFHHFSHIKQPRNQNPISNMWNGMHFPADVARSVVKAYVSAPHQENYMAALVDADGYEIDVDASEIAGRLVIRPGSREGHSGLRDGRGGQRAKPSSSPKPPVSAGDWPSHCMEHVEQHGADTSSFEDNDTTPTATVRRGTSTKPSVNHQASAPSPMPTVQPGSYPFKLNEDGTISPILQIMPSQIDSTPTQRSFPQLDGHTPAPGAHRFGQTYDAASASTEKGKLVDNGLAHSASFHAPRSALCSTGDSRAENRKDPPDARARPSKASPGLNIDTQAANSRFSVAAQYSVQSSPLYLGSSQQAAPASNPRPMRFARTPLITPSSRTAYAFQPPEIAKSAHHSPMLPKQPPFGYSLPPVWNPYPLPTDANHLKDEYNFTVNRLKELTRKLSGGKFGADGAPATSAAGFSTAAHAGNDEDVGVRKCHRAHDSDFTKSFDARLTADALKLIASPKAAEQPTPGVGEHRLSSDSAASFITQMPLPLDKLGNVSKRCSAGGQHKTNNSEGVSSDNGFRLEG